MCRKLFGRIRKLYGKNFIKRKSLKARVAKRGGGGEKIAKNTIIKSKGCQEGGDREGEKIR